MSSFIPDNVYLTAQTIHIGQPGMSGDILIGDTGMSGSTEVLGDLNVRGFFTAGNKLIPDMLSVNAANVKVSGADFVVDRHIHAVGKLVSYNGITGSDAFFSGKVEAGSEVINGTLDVSGLVTASAGITGTNAHFSGNVFSSDTDLNKLNANMERLYKYFFLWV